MWHTNCTDYVWAARHSLLPALPASYFPRWRLIMDFLTTLFIAVFFFLMGAAIVGFIWYLLGVSRRMRKGSPSDVPDDPDLDEIARLKRHTQNQELVVEMDGKNYNAAHALSPAQERRLTFTSNVLTRCL